MKDIAYGIVEETYVLGSERRSSYGIALFSDAVNCGTSTIIDEIGDITDNRKQLEVLVEQCNKLELSPLHFRDVVEDFKVTA